jgi:2-iminobutanoate/2-iminopropanoate deaminase
MALHPVTGSGVFRDAEPPYSLALEARGSRLLFISGQLPQASDGALVGKGDFEAQAVQVLTNIKALVEASGGHLSDVAKLTMFVTSREFFPKFFEIRRRFFSEPYPAASAIVVAGLASPDWLVEIEAIAVLNP